MTSKPLPESDLDQELEAKLTLFVQLAEKAAEYEKLKKELNPVFKGVELIVVGKYKITGQSISSPEKITKAYSYWRWWIKPA